jgi:hypothetical protein
MIKIISFFFLFQLVIISFLPSQNIIKQDSIISIEERQLLLKKIILPLKLRFGMYQI